MNNYRKWVRQREAFMGYARRKSDYISNARRLEALHKETYLFLSERKQNLISLLLQESRISDSFEQEGLRRIFAITVLKKLIMIGFKN